MNREYHRWWSPRLHRHMEMLVCGHGGIPMIVFPTSRGRYFEYEDRGMIGAIQHKLTEGSLMAFCVDSIDGETWYNRAIHPADRVRRHHEYEEYILNEVLPLVRQRTGHPCLVATGCSLGGFTAANIAFRYPQFFTHLVSMSGAFDINMFLDGWYSDDAYLHCAAHFLPNLPEGEQMDQIRRMHIQLYAGEHDPCLGQNQQLAHTLAARHIPHRLEVWAGFGHDWPWWQDKARKFFWPMYP